MLFPTLPQHPEHIVIITTIFLHVPHKKNGCSHAHSLCLVPEEPAEGHGPELQVEQVFRFRIKRSEIIEFPTTGIIPKGKRLSSTSVHLWLWEHVLSFSVFFVQFTAKLQLSSDTQTSTTALGQKLQVNVTITNPVCSEIYTHPFKHTPNQFQKSECNALSGRR